MAQRIAETKVRRARGGKKELRTNASNTHTHPPAVLVVDDDADLCHLLGAALRKEGFVVETLGTAPSWELLERLDPCVIFLDIGLGAEDGTLVCNQIHRHPRHAHRPVVLISGRPEERLRADASTCDADGYLSKPFATRLVVDLARHHAQAREHEERL